MVVFRDGKNLEGRLLGFMLGTIGSVLEKAFVNSFKAIETRNASTKGQDTAGRMSARLSADM